MNRSVAPFSRRPLALMLASLALGVSLNAHAQSESAPSAAPTTAPTTTSIEEPGKKESTLAPVTVKANTEKNAATEGSRSYTTEGMSTATGLNLSPRETPQSVSVVTRQRIVDQGMNSITDAVQNVTGVSAKEYDSARFSFSARGFDVTRIMTDGLPMTWDAGWTAGESMSDLNVYDRVEVVRGATGLTMGSGNPSAAINLVRKHATSKVLTGEVSLTAGSWDHRAGSVDLTTPLNSAGTVRGRVVLATQKQNSFVNLEGAEHKVGYGVIDADLTPNTKLSIGASSQDNDLKGTRWGGLPVWFSDGSRTNWDRSTTTAANWSSWDSTQRSYFVNMEHRFDNDWKLSGMFNQAENRGDLKLLFLFSNPDRNTGLGLIPFPAMYDTTRTQRDATLQLTGPFSLLGRKHEVSFGVQHAKQKFTALGDQHDGSLDPNPDSIYTWNGTYPEADWGHLSLNERFITREKAAYGVVRFNVADPLKLIVGSRAMHWNSTGVDFSGRPFDSNHNKITPYAGLIYDVTPSTSAYVSYSDIFNPQTFRDRNLNYLDPLEGKNYEVGVKSEFMDGRFNTSFALFQVRQNNLAKEDGPLLGGAPGELAYIALQGTKSEGYEFEVSGELTPGLELSLGWTQFSAKDASGNNVNTNHPRKMLKAFTSYRLAGAWKGLTLGGGVNWEGANYTTTTANALGNDDRMDQPAYALVNLMARYEFSPAYSLQLNVNNVFDKTYYSQIGFYDQLAFGAPRNAYLNFRYKF